MATNISDKETAVTILTAKINFVEFENGHGRQRISVIAASLARGGEDSGFRKLSRRHLTRDSSGRACGESACRWD